MEPYGPEAYRCSVCDKRFSRELAEDMIEISVPIRDCYTYRKCREYDRQLKEDERSRKLESPSTSSKNRDPVDHKYAIKKWFDDLLIPKYDKGRKEHSGHLWRKRVIDFLPGEAVDLVVYLQTLTEQWSTLETLTNEAVKAVEYIAPRSQAYEKVLRIAHMLAFGNPDGMPETETNVG